MLSEVAVSLGKIAPVAFRINPDVDAGTHAKISTGKAENKFGVPISRALAAFALADRMPGLDTLGVALHLRSQFNPHQPREADFTREGGPLSARQKVCHGKQ